MVSMVKECFHSVSTKEDMPYSSFFLEAGPEGVRVTAFDTKRISIRGQINFSPQKEIIINGQALKTVCQLVDRPVVTFTEKALFINDRHFIARINSSGNVYPRMHTLFPDCALRFVVNRKEFLQGCNVLRQLGQEMLIQRKENELVLAVDSAAGIGRSIISIVRLLSDNLKASLKYRVNLARLAEALDSIYENEVELIFGGNYQPICIRGRSYIEVILCYINGKSYR